MAAERAGRGVVLNRVATWADMPMERWQTAVNSELDSIERRFDEVDEDVASGIRRLRDEVAEVKENVKWVQRTMWGVAVMLLMVLAGLVANLMA